MTPAQQARREREELAARFNAWIDANITPSRTADGEVRRDKYKLTKLDEEGLRELDQYLGEMGLAWHCDEFRRGELTSVGTVRIAIAVKRLLRATEMSND